MKLFKNVPAVLIIALMSVPSFAEVTDGAIPCNDVASNQEMYGCFSQEVEVANKKLSCLDAIKKFQVPKKSEANQNEFTKPGKIVKGKEMIALGKENGKIAFIDKNKNYHLSKEKIKRIIEQKLGASAGSKPHYCVIVQSPKGKIKLKFKKKQLATGSFDLGSYEKLPMSEGEAVQEDDAFIALGSQDEISDSNQVASTEQDELASKVQNFDSEVDQKLAEIDTETQEKITETRNQSNLSVTDKEQLIQGLNADKLEKRNYWLEKKRKKLEMMRHARRKCHSESNVIAQSVFEGVEDGEGFGGPSFQGLVQSK